MPISTFFLRTATDFYRPGICFFTALLGMLGLSHVCAQQIDIVREAGSHFGASVAVLPNGNIVATAPGETTTALGAVYLFSPAGALISTLSGTNPGDRIGIGGIVVLTNGNYVINSPYWKQQAGAVTWGSGTTGVSGQISSDNSIVGNDVYDWVGSMAVTALDNGNYVVCSWHNAAGAVTWGNGSTGTGGTISMSNSLVGNAGDQVGTTGIVTLRDGNYVVPSHEWSNGDNARAGAVTWCNGNTGCTGFVSVGNSLVGDTANDFVGTGVTALSNGNFVVSSEYWHSGIGAATWGNGSIGSTGIVSAINSLVGTAGDDRVGAFVTALGNGNYVVASPTWDNGILQDAGAVTWGNGTDGATGLVDSGNSLVGTAQFDEVGKVTALSDGNYVVAAPRWNGTAGAVAWADGSTGRSGAISASDSLLGSAPGDFIGLGDGTVAGTGVTALTNGNYVVASSYWHDSAGAVTWVNGGTHAADVVSASNSLIGTSTYDEVGRSVLALANGNYVVVSEDWNGGIGAVTWGDGAIGTTGVVSVGNSLIGTSSSDHTGLEGVAALGNGNYAVATHYWTNDGVSAVGAVTWGDGYSGSTGTVSTGNSLVGNTSNDYVGRTLVPVGNGNFVVASPEWTNGSASHAGAITLARGTGPIIGTISAENSVMGTIPSGGGSIVFGYDTQRDQLVVGRPMESTVTLFRMDLLFRNSFD